MKRNCWEFLKCGYEVGGANVNESGVCVAATETRTHGINSGKNGGRACWALAGTLCGGKTQGSYVMKLPDCMKCEFYKLVREEEGANQQSSKTILEKLA